MLPFKSDSNSSLTLEDATQYHLSLSLEWLTGCQFSCKGCHVNKDATETYTWEQLVKLNSWLESMQTQGNYLPTIAFIGPTDFLTATNIRNLLRTREICEILSKFKRISLQTTFLNMDNAEELCRMLRQRFSDKELEINFIIEPEKINNEKYMNTIKEARSKFMEMLAWPKYVASFCIMNVYEYDRVKKNDVKQILADYKALNDKIRDEFNTTIDFNFSMLRNSWWSNKDVEEAVKSVSRIFDAAADHEFNQTVRFSFGKLTDSKIEKHYNWHQGKLYVSPMLYERIASFHPSLEIKHTEFTLEETERFEYNLLVNQYESAARDKPDCNDCQYQSSCIERNIITFMDMHDIKRCIIARKALDAINVIS